MKYSNKNSNKKGPQTGAEEALSPEEIGGKSSETKGGGDVEDTAQDSDVSAGDCAGAGGMQKEMEELKEKAEAANDKYVRMAAEFDNYRRRTAKERIELISTASEDVIKGLLPILDDFERALKVLRESNDYEAAVEGTELIYNKLSAYLKSKGLSVIEALDKELDTEFHEAVAQFPTDIAEKKNRVIDIVQQGYMLNGKVIRYAKVVVGV